MTEKQKSYYAIIPANVRYDKSLTANAKLLYGEITALCNSEGQCWASNKYFADLYEVSVISISNWINALINKGYISSHFTYKEGTKEIDKRYITILYDPLKKTLIPLKENFNTPLKENFKDNNTSINNTKEYIKEIDKEKSDKPTTLPRKKYGMYSNVLLTDEDIEKLKNEFPSDYEKRIERLSEYKASSGKKYKSDLATIRMWARKDKGGQEKTQKTTNTSFWDDKEIGLTL